MGYDADGDKFPTPWRAHLLRKHSNSDRRLRRRGTAPAKEMNHKAAQRMEGVRRGLHTCLSWSSAFRRLSAFASKLAASKPLRAAESMMAQARRGGSMGWVMAYGSRAGS
jgi:hypothetical protein